MGEQTVFCASLTYLFLAFQNKHYGGYLCYNMKEKRNYEVVNQCNIFIQNNGIQHLRKATLKFCFL